jgi:ATP-dependent Clp protease ATP-binding subunit ClpA
LRAPIFSVEIEHWLLKLLEMPDGDLAKILLHHQVNIDRLTADLNQTIDGFKTGSDAGPSLARTVEREVRGKPTATRNAKHRREWSRSHSCDAQGR